jgi:hypothetical protein
MAEDLQRTKLSEHLEAHVREKVDEHMEVEAKAKSESTVSILSISFFVLSKTNNAFFQGCFC